MDNGVSKTFSSAAQENAQSYIKGQKDNINFEEQLFLTDLPDVALVGIMEYLNLKERYYLSQTCHLFHDLFSHSKLWRDAHISLLPVSGRWKLTSVMNHTMVEIVKRFSHLFQHLTLQMSGYVQELDKDCLKMLSEMNEECRLVSLTLEMGSLTSKDIYIKQAASVYSNICDIPLVVKLVKNAVRLRQLNLISWPLHRELEDSYDIFKAIIDNKKLQYLESFNFFFLGKTNGVWSERYPHLPSPEKTLEVISHLKSLKHLSIRSTMLSNELLLTLASKDRNRLESLQILVMWTNNTFSEDGFKIPQLDSSSWAALKMASPNVKVECFVVTRIPEDQLCVMLNEEVPLHALNIMNYGRCDNAVIYSLAEKFKNTLNKFVSLCDSSDCDEVLLQLVRNCRHLRYLKYHGEVTHKTVITISDIYKERKVNMTCFEFLEKSIKTDIPPTDEDDDLVIARDTERQELYIVSLCRWHEDEDERCRRIDSMSRKVSENLGINWRPLSM